MPKPNSFGASFRRLFSRTPQVQPPMHIDLNKPAEVSLLKQRLLSLPAECTFEGFKQRDGNNFPFMKGWVLRRHVSGTLPGQHVLVFFNGAAEKAVVWVESDSSEIPVPNPQDPSDPESLEAAIDLSGEAFADPTVKPDGKVYVLRYMRTEW